MGYDTWHNVNIYASSKEEKEQIKKEIVQSARIAINPENGFLAHWYDRKKDVSEIAKRHPDTIIEITGDGNAPDDVWAERYHGLQYEHVEREGLPPFRKIFFPEELKNAYDKTQEEIREAKDRMSTLAKAYIGMLAKRITEGKDYVIDLTRLNLRYTQVRISVYDKETETKHRSAVKYVYTDGTITDEDTGNEHPVAELDEYDIADVIRFLEDTIKEIMKQEIACQINDEEEEYVLVYADTLEK